MVDTERRTTAVGVFENRDTAERAVDELYRAGFTSDQIGFVARDPDAEGVYEEGTQTGEGAATGAITGGVIGGLLGAAAALLVPGVGPVIAGGVLAATLGGAAIGATAGGLIGALVGMGVPEEEARYYQGEFESGRTLVTVDAGSRYDDAITILRTHGGYDYLDRGDTSRTFGHREAYESSVAPGEALETDTSHRPTTSSATGTFNRSAVGSSAPSTLGTTGNTNLNVSTSNVEIHDTQGDDVDERYVATSGAGTGGRSVTWERTRDVSTDDVDTDSSGTGGAVTGDVIPGRADEVAPSTETREVKVPYPQTDSEVGPRGTTPKGALVEGDDAGVIGARDFRDTDRDITPWESSRDAYRRDWERQTTTSNRGWEDVEPRYHYGYAMAVDERYHGRDWNEIEPELRTGYADWARARGYRLTDDAGRWEELREDVYEAWSRTRADRFYGEPGDDFGERRPIS